LLGYKSNGSSISCGTPFFIVFHSFKYYFVIE